MSEEENEKIRICDTCGKEFDLDKEGGAYGGTAICQKCMDEWADEHRCSVCGEVFKYDYWEEGFEWFTLSKSIGNIYESEEDQEVFVCSLKCMKEYIDKRLEEELNND